MAACTAFAGVYVGFCRITACTFSKKTADWLRWSDKIFAKLMAGPEIWVSSVMSSYVITGMSSHTYPLKTSDPSPPTLVVPTLVVGENALSDNGEDVVTKLPVLGVDATLSTNTDGPYFSYRVSSVSVLFAPTPP